MKMTPLEMALTVAQKYPVFAVRADKSPATQNGFKAASRDPEEIKRQFSLPGAALVGVPTGSVSGLFVIDCDPAGADWLDCERLVLPKTREHTTRRGVHLLFKMPTEPFGCSTSKLAPGVDVRADGGFIVWWPAAGLPFKSGDLAAVPGNYLAALRHTTVEGTAADVMSPAHKAKTHVTAEGASALLDMVDPDCSYDDWRAIGMGLQHEFGDEGLALWLGWSAKGKKYPGDTELETKWDSFGRYDGPPVTLRYLIKLAKGQSAEAKAVAAPIEARSSPFRIVRAVELALQKPPGWIIRNLLPRADLGMLFAAGGSGKTFFALDVAMHIAGGVQWRNRQTEKGRVLYICAEGAGGFGTRVNAGMQGNPNLAAAMADPSTVFEVLTGAPNFLDDKTVDRLVEQAKLLGGFDFVVVDTVAQVTPGGNENTGEDMGRLIGNCRKFNTAFGAFVWLLHHPGKDATKGARGWSGVFGALDVELEITRAGDDRIVKVTKQKDGVEGEQFGFRLETQTVEGVVDDGMPAVSCRVEPLADLPKNDKPRRKDGPVEALILKHAADCAGVTGGPFSVEVLYRAVREEMTYDPEGRDQRRARFNTAVERLGNEARLTLKGELVELIL